MGKQFVITSEILLKVVCGLWEDSEDRFFFDYDTYEIREKDDLVEGSYTIPLVHVSQVTVMKDFIVSLNNRKLIEEFRTLSDQEAWSRFWIHFDDDGPLSSRWHEFEENYCKKLITDWCENNGISFRMDLK
ncbi:MAG: hypothetical protein IK020_07415 [Clostridiales bacterium]|nr:hypothetical protein [Clostridiales bacterium]